MATEKTQAEELLQEFVGFMNDRNYSDSGKMDRLIETKKKAEAYFAESEAAESEAQPS